MLHVQNLRKAYGATTVLEDITFVLNDGERVGLIGPNGTGKSTLLRCLVGLEQPDGGRVLRTPAQLRVGYLPQAFADDDHRSLTEALDAHTAPEGRLRPAPILAGLGLQAVDPHTPVNLLSGGQKTRLGLATLLLDEPDLLLLDEPTNHLDVEALEWLEGFVSHFRGGVLIVSHDRVFLDATVDRVLYLDPETRTLRSYTGSYRDFADARAHERELQQQTWKQQQDYVHQVRADIGRLKSEARSIEVSTTARQPGLRKFARRKAALAKSRERKLERYLASDERVERPMQRWPINLRFGEPPSGSQVMLRCQDVAFGYPGTDGYLFEHVSFEVRYGQRLAVVGPNGSGKTTLLRLLEGELQPGGGRILLGPSAHLGVMSQEQETLDPRLSVLETVLRERAMSEQDARSFLPFFLFYGDSVFKPVGACSLGERSRLQLACLVLRGCNLLLLDEPINHLDVESREHFEAALEAFEGSIVVVAHDRAFLRAFSRHMLELRDGAAILAM
ncbi:MAG: ABC-F family ATP-binding cassette domain-containing protein [Chloroflexi bacterium]|nr:ABC-F family ATP-binding cassette domain-containing protein [Chloroflexota bacterium]